MKSGIAKSLFIFGLLVLLNGCASSAPPLPPSLELPSPVTDLRALRKGDKIFLAWTEPTKTTDHQSMRNFGPTVICRSQESGMKECGTRAGVMPAPEPAQKPVAVKQAHAAKTTAIYSDSLPMLPGVQPTDKITYAVEVQNASQRAAGLSNQVQVPALPAVPPPDGFQAAITAQGVRITWSCSQLPQQLAGVEYRLRIFRRVAGSQTDDKIGEPELAACATPLIDASMEWEKTYDYRAAVVTMISPAGGPAMEIEGDDTPSVRMVAHDVFPPAVPSGVQAVFSGPGQQPFVDLIWQPVSDADFAGYNVYRREAGGEAVKLNSELVKTPAYRDGKVQSGKAYFYSASSVDLRGNESAKSEEASETVP